MPDTFKDLTPAKQQAFWAQIEKWGLSKDDVHEEINTADFAPHANKLSAAEHVQSKAKPFVIKNVQQMKELVGISDAHFASGKMRDRTVHYPAPLPQHRLALAKTAPNNCFVKESLSSEEHDNLKQAWQAYLVGDSRKIAPETVDMINAVHFPTTVMVAAAQNITVNPGQNYPFGTPGSSTMQVIPIGTLTILPGGSVSFISPVTLQVQQTNAQVSSTPSVKAVQGVALDASSGDNNFSFYTPAPPPPPQPGGQPPRSQANNATPGQTTTTTGKNPTTSCTTPSTGASGGDTGYPGTGGTAGQRGISPPPVIAHLGDITGTYNFFAGGGTGQNGGQGGNAGTGGQGGNGASGAGGKCSNQAPGKGGLGGTGGTGGTPGDGAPGSTSYFYYTSKTQPFSFNLQTAGGYGGQPGLGGGYGEGGSGGSDPAGTQGPGYVAANYTNGPGQTGATGNNGQPGNNANPGMVYLNQEPGS